MTLTKDTLKTPSAAFAMISAAEARSIVLEKSKPLDVQYVSFDVAQGHVIGEDVVAREPVPAYRASIKDGYSVVSSDGPGLYPVVFECHAGSTEAVKMVLKENQVAYISTGGPVPEGSDAVVQVEDTRMTDDVIDGQHSVVEICKKVESGEDIRAIGSDMMPGELVMKKGEYIGAGEIAMLATVGVTEIPVYRKPTVAIISTGDEVEEPTIEVLPMGKVRDANRAMLVTAVLEAGARPIDMGIARDSEENVEKAINEAISMGSDIIITTGGVSMGSKDFIKPILARKGTIHFGKICMKPGKPCTFATIESNVIVFGLPGNPVSALTTFNLLVGPCIRRLSGFPEDKLEIRAQAVTSFPIKMDSSRTEYRRVRVTFERESSETSSGKLVAHDIAGSQISSRIMSYREANALMIVPSRADMEIEDGILPLGSLLPVIMLQTKRIL
jgi:gephyrin